MGIQPLRKRRAPRRQRRTSSPLCRAVVWTACTLFLVVNKPSVCLAGNSSTVSEEKLHDRHDAPPTFASQLTVVEQYDKVGDQCEPESDGYFGGTANEPAIVQYKFDIEENGAYSENNHSIRNAALLKTVRSRVMEATISTTFPALCHARSLSLSNHSPHRTTLNPISGFRFSEIVNDYEMCESDGLPSCDYFRGSVSVYGSDLTRDNVSVVLDSILRALEDPSMLSSFRAENTDGRSILGLFSNRLRSRVIHVPVSTSGTSLSLKVGLTAAIVFVVFVVTLICRSILKDGRSSSRRFFRTVTARDESSKVVNDSKSVLTSTRVGVKNWFRHLRDVDCGATQASSVYTKGRQTTGSGRIPLWSRRKFWKTDIPMNLVHFQDNQKTSIYVVEPDEDDVLDGETVEGSFQFVESPRTDPLASPDHSCSY